MRRRWIYINGEPIEVTDDYLSQPRSTQATDGVLWSDKQYENLRATDGTDIGSRSRHRAYLRDHNLAMAEDYKNEWAEAQKKRDLYRTQGIGGAVRREDVERAIHELQRRK